jgi:NAD(P)-dependent dehydrogenase (short-subunit alcohol dehydrogenase family)
MAPTHSSARVALVTGASRGIGAAVVVELARLGIVPVLAVRRPDSAQDTVAAVKAQGIEALVVACHVEDLQQARSAVSATMDRFGRLDILINNAGVVDPMGPVGEVDAAQWDQAIRINLTGPYLMIDAALDALKKSPTGTVINVSTGAAHAPRLGWSAYCSSKAGLAMLTRCLALEWGPNGVAAFGLQPGMVDTGMQTQIRAAKVNEVSHVPREQLAKPERAAKLIAWLADQRPMDLNGQDLTIRDAALVARAGIDA